jgi:hypothetical protein
MFMCYDEPECCNPCPTLWCAFISPLSSSFAASLGMTNGEEVPAIEQAVLLDLEGLCLHGRNIDVRGARHEQLIDDSPMVDRWFGAVRL